MNNVDFTYAGGNEPHYTVDRFLSNGAEMLYTSEDGYHRMFAYNPDSSYKVISSSVLIGALKNADSLSTKPYLLAEIVNYFLGIETATNIRELFDKKIANSVTAYPNPSSSSTTIGFTLKTEGSVKADIFDVNGRHIKAFKQQVMPSGQHDFIWNGSNDAGTVVQNGVYFYQINIDGKIESGKIVLNR
ncbi:MAG: T9SS type A sorting domain-containing protein [Bacteroidales bacterium]|jgi:hypothetical protein|nr:T9SS type A sorting domain-containing protein [Lentimicrobium sp.]HNY59602.1 T9SS type A sorting domain-containing protein [Bacteroidales bacterium]HOG66715.1 T9SS type A sorting domain-containing protein [Bacteroidales bacterium]HPA12579.1 T9SS type A sorting domain-containing protein [Bacteroidales bacterium]HQF01905.1 T9SS type A sorting domain-containing protein [Bacteroidales bacterium]